MPKYFTPTQFNKSIKAAIDTKTQGKRLDITGEISNMKNHSNGNLYFTIKDATSQINATMFGNNAKNLGFVPRDGMQVNMNVSVFFNVKNAMFSLNANTMEQTGIGDLAMQFEKLKADLLNEGLFEPYNKKEIPTFPKTIAVITSPTGAAVLDIISTIKRRYPICKIIVVPTLVQGVNAKYDIVEKIKYVNEFNLADTIICGRGGGSIEDLWSFNEEMVVRAIFDSEIPIISSVGHETDTTIADFVADVRAATPTAAAEIATPDIFKLNSDIAHFENVMRKVLMDKVVSNQNKLKHLSENQYFLNPILAKRMAFDNTSMVFDNKIVELNGSIKLRNSYINKEFETMKVSIVNMLKNRNNDLKVLHSTIDVLNPLSTLSRGYSITTINDKVVSSSDDVMIGDIITSRVKEGIIKSTVIEK